MDVTIADHERRLTRLEERSDINLRAVMAKLEILEEDLKQRQIDREQAERREMADLRGRLQAAEQART